MDTPPPMLSEFESQPVVLSPWRQRLASRLARYSAHRLEFVSAYSLMLLGAWLALFAREPLSYAFLADMGSLRGWGMLLWGVGFISRLGLVRGDQGLRRWGMLSIFVVRVFLLVGVSWGTGFVSMTIPDHIAWASLALWAFWRVERD